MITIRIQDNKYCIIDTKNFELLQAIRREFSYKLAGIEFTPKVKAGLWDGTTYLLQQKNGETKLPLGLLERLKVFLSKNGYESVIDDQRPELVPEPEIDLTAKLAQLNMPLRDYQERIIETAFRQRKGIIRAATGSGKSVCIAGLVAKINKPTVIYIIGLDLLGQFHKTLTELFDEKIGYIGNGICDIQRINVASVWTIGRSLGLKNDIIDDETSDREILKIENTQNIIKLLKNTKCHILDECHLAGCETIKQIHKVIDPERIYGFSATPSREDNSDLNSFAILGDQIINVSASELIKKGYLAEPHILFVNAPKKYAENEDYHSIYRDCIVEHEGRNALVVSNAKMLLSKGYKVLVLFRQLKHGKILQEMFDNENIEIEMLTGEDSLERRDEIKSRMIDGKLNAILASTIFDTGIDLPILSGLVLAGAGKSKGRCLQKIGRSIRKYPGKETVAIVDFIDNAKYLKQHSKKRYDTYSEEDGFIVKWPNEK